jgi:hypothetical protein
LTFDAHRDGDFAPYVYRTIDFGASWTPLAGDLPSGSVNVLVEHADNPNLLFLGTEHALFVSTDAGAQWTRVPGLPTTLYDDLLIHARDNDLIVGTHGRSIYVLDDVGPLVEWSPAVAASDAHLFAIRPATMFQFWKDTSYRGQAAFAGENPPFGAIISYFLAAADEEARITVTRANGDVVRVLQVPGAAGLHRVTWDLRDEPPPFDPDDLAAGSALPVPPQPVTPRGPFVSPGTYTVALEAGGVRLTQTVAVTGDPLMSISDEEWRQREEFLVELLELQHEVHDAAQRAGCPPDPDGTAGAACRTLDEVASDLRSLAREFNGRGVRQGSLYPPTETQRRRKAEAEAEAGEALAALRRVGGS